MKCIKTKVSTSEWKYEKISDSLAQTMMGDGRITLDREDLSKVPVGKAVYISKSEYKRNA